MWGRVAPASAGVGRGERRCRRGRRRASHPEASRCPSPAPHPRGTLPRRGGRVETATPPGRARRRRSGRRSRDRAPR
ncbi:hypothetical protein EBB05_24680 [Methylobacterium brachiatum]|nr:hypothetical protein EBB05_24680 [Methylobacterium brachiatum]